MSAHTEAPPAGVPVPEDAYRAARWTPAHREFRAARDLLLRHRTDPDTAAALFRWPRPEHFNWALEWFDVVAAGNDRPALELADPEGGVRGVSYAELSRRSDAVANWLAGLGVARGDRLMVVLGTQPELWEVLLAALKIGAVVVPSHPDLTSAQAADRVRRGRLTHLVCRTAATAAFDGVTVPGARVAVPGPGRPVPPGWTDYRGSERAVGRFVPERPTPADDVAFCYFTSGTTSAPKLVAHTHLSYPAGHLSSLYWNGLLPGDRQVNVSSPGWAKHSWSSLFVPWNAEATIVALPEGAVDAAALPRLLHRLRATAFCAPPSVWQALRPHLGSCVPRLREATSAGEPLPPDLADAVRDAWDVAVRDGYGQTETTALIGTPPGATPRPGLLGRPLPGYRITLRDPETGARLDVAGGRGVPGAPGPRNGRDGSGAPGGTAAPDWPSRPDGPDTSDRPSGPRTPDRWDRRSGPGAPEGPDTPGLPSAPDGQGAVCSGEICVELGADGDPAGHGGADGGRPVGVMAGYPDDPERTEQALGRGWYATGDLGERDADGWIRVLGRRDDVFKSHGHRVSPYEAEAALRAHPAVAEVAVVPVPDDRAGLLPLAVVVPASGRTADAALAGLLLELAERTLSPVGRPERLCFAERLPRTTSGKIQRRVVRERLAEYGAPFGRTSIAAGAAASSPVSESPARS
ncbi:AMP-binding protein [Streptomyces sp. NBC_00289]|uniref:AMP-binding protein n=1 Tax=Streptomyces sp. NBC_00289 TaxID=2975703 RepID=UPI003247E9CA